MKYKKTIILILLLALGILAQQMGWFDWQWLYERCKQYAHMWWFPLAIIASMIVLFAFAQAGSMLFWVAGLFYETITATIIIVAGGVGGALAAYAFSHRLSGGFVKKLPSSRYFRFIRRHTDAATLCAVRITPNFPHSVINYGAGILGVPIPRFLITAFLGFTIKGFIYASIARNAATADKITDILNLKTIGLLLVLAALFLAGNWILKYGLSVSRKRKQKVN
jgi:uncharacterized membrane protein YdjX (TVP38/TMEM64 family)